MNTDPASLVFHGLWMLSAMGAAVFSSMPAAPWQRVAGIGLGIALSLALAAVRFLDPATIGTMAAAIALAQLLRPGSVPLSLVVLTAAGALGGFWSALLISQGLPRLIALGAAVALVGGATILTVRRPTFAPELLRDESLLIVLTLGLGVAVSPAVVAGWHAAASLNVPQPVHAAALPAWTLGAVVSTCAVGGLYTWWIRR